MAIRKRGSSWQIDYLDPNGKRVQLSFRKKKDAEAEYGKRVSLIAEKRYLDVKREYQTTLGELIEKYVENFKHQRSWNSSKGCYLKGFKDSFGADTRLSNITRFDIETYQNTLRTKLTRAGKKLRKPASINREMACLGHMLNKSVEWEMVEASPVPKKLHLKENNKRNRYLTEEEAAKLLSECKYAPHVRRVVLMALNTGMRRGEILSLKWDQIRDGLIYLTVTKTNESRQIPVNDDVAAMLKEIRQEQGLSSEYIFPFRGKKIASMTTAFNAACRRAGIRDFHFHDLRHTFASQLVIRGASIKEIQELLGHSDSMMTMRYAHLAPENKQRAVGLLNGFGKCDKNVTSQKIPDKPLLSLVKS